MKRSVSLEKVDLYLIIKIYINIKIAPFRLIILYVHSFFRNSSVLVRISWVPYKYVPIFMCIFKYTYYIRIRIYAQQLKIHTIMIVRVWLEVCKVCVLTEHSVVLLAGRGWPHASQGCCDSRYCKWMASGSTKCRTKWYLISMCWLRLCVKGLRASLNGPYLSPSGSRTGLSRT